MNGISISTSTARPNERPTPNSNTLANCCVQNHRELLWRMKEKPPPSLGVFVLSWGGRFVWRKNRHFCILSPLAYTFLLLMLLCVIYLLGFEKIFHLFHMVSESFLFGNLVHHLLCRCVCITLLGEQIAECGWICIGMFSILFSSLF